MLEASIGKFTYDSANRLVTAGTRYYTYDVEGTRIKTQKGEDTTKFIYNVNARLSQLLVMTENNAETKYVYGLGLIGEEVSGNFKTYHFDYRGSTVAITNASGTVTDTFEYDTYGKLKSRTGTTKTPFLYNGRDGVITEDDTELYYMRARYYSPALRRFVNADKVHGDITNALSLNRYAFVNGNPASNVDPLGLSAERVGVGTAWGGINGASYSSSATAQRRMLDEAIKKYRQLYPIGPIDIEELRKLIGNGMVWTTPDSNVTYLPIESVEDEANHGLNGVKWTAVGLTAICVGVSVMTCGVATPLMMFIAGTTAVAGTATTVNGISEIGDAITGYNFMEDGVFQGNSEAYNIYAGTTEVVSEVGTVICGSWLKANSPRIKAYNNMDSYNVKRKHLPESNGDWSKFSTSNQSELRRLGKEAIRNSPMDSLSYNSSDSYRTVYEYSKVIGTKGETQARIIFSDLGKIITFFPE